MVPVLTFGSFLWYPDLSLLYFFVLYLHYKLDMAFRRGIHVLHPTKRAAARLRRAQRFVGENTVYYPSARKICLISLSYIGIRSLAKRYFVGLPGLKTLISLGFWYGFRKWVVGVWIWDNRRVLGVVWLKILNYFFNRFWTAEGVV